MNVTSARVGSAGEAGSALDTLLRGAERRGAGTIGPPLGEWLRAYQRATHYFRALDIREPPPHLMACTVLERALRRDPTNRIVNPLRLAMEEVHTLLWEQVRERVGSLAGSLGQDSVCWRAAAWLAQGTVRIPAGTGTDGGAAAAPRPEGVRPLPDPVPAPMAPQSFEFFSLKRLLDAITGRWPRPAFGTTGKRPHA
jgi:hypothetical protein